MKKFVVSLLALALTVPFAFAQTVSSTGTYTGEVAGKCLVRVDLTGDQAMTSGNNYDPADFDDSFSNSDTYTYQSNTDCTAEYSATQEASNPEQLSGSDVLSCNENGTTTLIEAQDPAEVGVTFLAQDTDGILSAGQYDFTCNVNINPAS